MKNYSQNHWHYIVLCMIKYQYTYKELEKSWEQKFPGEKIPKRETVSRYINAYQDGMKEKDLNIFKDKIELFEKAKEDRREEKEIAKLNLLKTIVNQFTVPKIKLPKQTENKQEKTHLVLFGDVQETGNHNCILLFENLVSKIKKDCHSQKIVLIDVGDHIEGWLRTSSLISSQGKDVFDQILIYLEGMIKYLLTPLLKTYQVDFLTVTSNHGQMRMLGSKANEFESFDVLKIIKYVLNLKFSAVKHFQLFSGFEVYYPLFSGKINLLVQHGQFFKMNSARYLTKFAEENNKKPIDFLIHGHQHL